MERPLLDRDGQPMVLHRPSGPERGVHSGVTILGPEDDPMTTKADRSGVYTLNGARFKIRKGDPLPAGAVMEGKRKQGGSGGSRVATAPAAAGTKLPEPQSVLVDPASLRQAIAEGRVSMEELAAIVAEHQPDDASTGDDTQQDPDAETPEGGKDAVTEERKQDPAPENKAKPAAPETKSKGAAPENRSKPAPKKKDGE